MEFDRAIAPWDGGDPAFPGEWVGGWVRGGHLEGRARVTALAEVHARLAPYGFVGTVLVGGAWLASPSSEVGRDTWRLGPWPEDAPRPEQLWAEGAGDAPLAWIREVVDAWLADPERAAVPLGPQLYTFDGGLIVDPAFIGRRPGLVLFRLAPAAVPLVGHLVAQRSSWWVSLLAAGLLRADGFWAHWDGLVALLEGEPTRGPGLEPSEQPVNPQEVTVQVARVAATWARKAAASFEAATVGLFLPDPDDEHVYCLAGHGLEVHAYDTGVSGRRPLPGIGFGLTASWAVGAAWDPRQGPVVVRHLAGLPPLHDRYRDLGFDEEVVLADRVTDDGPFQGERFAAPELLEAARLGPWTWAVQRLPPSLSPTGRNLVIRLQGRTLSARWSTAEERDRLSRDRRRRIATLCQRIHADLVRLYTDGLRLWRDGLRAELLALLTRSAAAPLGAACQTLASWTSTQVVSLWNHDDGALTLRAWSLPRVVPALVLATAERLDARELRLVAAPLYPRREEIGGEGFLGWASFDEAVGGRKANVGTVPVVGSGRTLGVLRVDGAMSLLAGHIPRRSPQGALHNHRPAVTPAHLRPALEEAAQLLALALDRPPATAPEPADDLADWTRFVERVRGGLVDADTARERLDALRRRAPSRGAAAALVGVHRNTFRRHLAQLREVLGDLVPY